MRNERTTDRKSVYGSLVIAAKFSNQRQALFAASLILNATDRGPELAACLGGQSAAAEPDVVGCGTVKR